jgi:sec-independent protein translocase protein TatA
MLHRSGLFGFGVGFHELVILGVVAFIVLVLFGNRLPSVMRNLGRGIVEFKKGARGVTDELESAVQEGEEGSSAKDDV